MDKAVLEPAVELHEGRKELQALWMDVVSSGYQWVSADIHVPSDGWILAVFSETQLQALQRVRDRLGICACLLVCLCG